MSDRDDAPPGEVVEAMARDSAKAAWEAGKWPLWRPVARRTLLMLRTLPDAARWRLAAWIVAGLEQTREMVEGALREEDEWRFMPAPENRVCRALRAALAVAREAGDGA